MKYCKNCGKENLDDAQFCLSCGAQLENAAEAVVEPYSMPKKSSLGKVSMILGIIGAALSIVCCCFPFLSIIIGPIAIITGIVFLVKCPDDKKGQAIAGIVLGAVALLIGIIMFASADLFEEALKQAAQELCNQDPNSEECQIYKETFPQWFE